MHTALALLFAASTALGGNYRLMTELTKTTLYEGEQIIATFMLYSDQSTVEAEVEKFPEFRGFWSENQALRQGPLGLVPGGEGDLPRKALIGTYSLIPMIGYRESRITSMQLVVKPAYGDGETLRLRAELPPFEIRPLPALPAGWTKEKFSGAVGNFTFTSLVSDIPFSNEEPASLKITLQGEGNFPEINRIPLELPADIEVLSQRSYTQGSGQFGIKAFELTLRVPRSEGFEIPTQSFLYFSPSRQSYQVIEIPTLRFSFVPRPKTNSLSDGEAPVWDEPHERWHAYSPLSRSIAFWFMNLTALALLAVVLLRDGLRQWAARRPPNLKKALLERMRSAEECLHRGETETFLRMADQIAAEVLGRRVRGELVRLTRHQLLTEAKGAVSESALEAARRLFLCHQSRFSPSRSSEIPGPDLSRDLKTVLETP